MYCFKAQVIRAGRIEGLRSMELDLMEDPSTDTSHSPHSRLLLRRGHEMRAPSDAHLDASSSWQGSVGVTVLNGGSGLCLPDPHVPQPLLPLGYLHGHMCTPALT